MHQAWVKAKTLLEVLPFNSATDGGSLGRPQTWIFTTIMLPGLMEGIHMITRRAVII